MRFQNKRRTDQHIGEWPDSNIRGSYLFPLSAPNIISSEAQCRCKARPAMNFKIEMNPVSFNFVLISSKRGSSAFRTIRLDLMKPRFNPFRNRQMTHQSAPPKRNLTSAQSPHFDTRLIRALLLQMAFAKIDTVLTPCVVSFNHLGTAPS